MQLSICITPNFHVN